MIRVTEGELLDALASAVQGTEPEDAMTMKEIIAETGLGLRRVTAALQVFAAQGRLQTVPVRRSSIDGRATKVPAYLVSPKKKAKK